MAGRSTFMENVIDTEQLFSDAVTQDKIADDAVGTDQIAAGVLSQNTRQAVAYLEVALTADAVVPIGTIPGGSLVTDAICVCTVAADGNGTITVGDTDADGIFTNSNITKTLNAVSGQAASEHGVELYSTTKRVYWVTSDTVFNATVVKGTSTVGTFRIYIFYERGVMSG